MAISFCEFGDYSKSIWTDGQSGLRDREIYGGHFLARGKAFFDFRRFLKAISTDGQSGFRFRRLSSNATCPTGEAFFRSKSDLYGGQNNLSSAEIPKRPPNAVAKG